MKEIKLTQGKVALVDDEDFEYLNQFKWYAHKGKHTFYARRVEKIEGKQSRFYMHRVLLGLDVGELCDHEDSNGLNNQKSNIRKSTYSQNNTNKRVKANKKLSNFYGVYKAKNRYKAAIGINKKTIHLGSFINEKDAALAYNSKALEVYGSFAKLNIL